MTGVVEAAVVALLLAFAAVKLLRRASRPIPAPSSLSEPALAPPPRPPAPQPASPRPPAEARAGAPVVAARGRPRRLRRVFVEMAVLGPPRGLAPWRASG